MSRPSGQWPPPSGDPPEDAPDPSGHDGGPTRGDPSAAGDASGEGEGAGSAWAVRLQPPWQDSRQGPEMVVWTVVGFLAVLIAPIVAFVFLLNFGVEIDPWLALGSPLPVLALLAVFGFLAGPSRVRAVAYGALLGFGAELAMVAIVAVVLVGLRLYLNLAPG
jgi:hypothetical protein